MIKRFKTLIDRNIIQSFEVDVKIIDELLDMKIDTIEKIDSIIPSDYVKMCLRFKASVTPPFEENFMSILRDILIIHDSEAYFNKAWKQRWSGISGYDLHMYKHYGVNTNKYEALSEIIC